MKHFQPIHETLSTTIKNFAMGGLALALGLFIGASRAHATAYVWTNTAGSFWSNPSAWSPNGVPGPSDTATFNAATTYTVTFTNSVVVSNIDLTVHSGSNMVLTLNLNGNSLSLIKPGSSSPAALFVGGGSGGTNTLYLSSSTGVGEGLFITNAVSQRATIGDSGQGTLIVTNGFVLMGTAGLSGNQMVLGNNSGPGSRGTLVLSGPSVSWSNNAAMLIGNSSSAYSNSLVISNSASMTCVGASLTVGGGGASTNSLLLDSDGRLFVTAVGANVGNGAGSGNSATVQNGAIWNLGNTPLAVGSTGAGNSLTVGMNGTVSNLTTLTIAPANSLVLSGGVVQAAVAVTNTSGTVAGFGTIVGNALFTGTGTLTPGFGNAVGAIVASNNLTLASGTTTIIKLDKTQVGSNDFLSVAGALTEAGTLMITNVGTLTGGEIFQIFSSANPTGNFAATNLPALTSGLSWNTTQLGTDGIISVSIGLSVIGPTNQSVAVGSNVTISAVVTGVPAPSLQWELDGNDLSDGPTTNGGSSIVGSLTSTLTISNVQPGDAGQYCLIASNSAGAVTNCMTLLVSGGPVAPTIIGPSNQNVVQGNTATFSASVSGVPSPTIQWQQNNVNIPGATGTPLILTNVQVSQNGYVYSIIASNSAGEATNSATLQVTVPSPSVLPALPNIPTNTFYITNYGAYGNGVSNNASAIQSAINAAGAAGGGTVIVASVGILTNYLSGPINLTNNVSLEIDSGAMLQALPMSSWPSDATPFITGANLHDIAINGFGTIDGQGSNWWAAGGTRPYLVSISGCTRILIQNVTAQNPPMYHFNLTGGNNTNATFQGITINTPTNSPNTDGIDLAVTNCLVQNCFISDGDDNICIKPSGYPCADIVVSNCTFGGGHGVSIGSDTSGGFQSFIVSNCSFNGTIYGIRCKSDNAVSGSGAGGLVQNLNYSNLTMTNVTYPIVIYSYYNEEGTPDEISPADAAGEEVGPTNNAVIWRNITIANVTATPLSIVNHSSSIVWGRLEMPASNITLTNVNIAAPSNTFCVYNAQGIQVIDSNLGDPNTKTNTFTLFNAQMTITNSAPNANLVTLGGLVEPGTNNTLGFFNAMATMANASLLASNQTLALGGSTLTVSNALNLGASTLSFSLGTNTTKVAATGNLTLGGTLDISDGGGFTNRTYTLFTYSGSLTYSGLTIGATPNPGFACAISTSTVGQVNLLVSAATGLNVVGPTNQSAVEGANVTISTVVTGVPAPSLQWELNGSDLSDGPTTNGGSSLVGSLTSTLTISNAQTGDSGQYCLIAANTSGAVTNCMILSVSSTDAPPTIAGPSNQDVIQGNTATFSASVSGVPVPAIQWQQNNVNIPGATGTPLILTNVQSSQNGYVYTIIASNSLGEATNSATLQVTVPVAGPPPPALPVIPTNTFYITNYGAVGDGVTDNSGSIQNTINAAAALGGGTVIVSSVGVLTNYLSGPINLTNNVSLLISSGTMLQALPKGSWPNANTALITATNVHDVAIDGSGVIDGQGSGWWPGGGTRPPLVQMAFTTRILIQNVTAQNPPFYHFRLIGGNGDLTVQNITINTETNSPNTDGVDISGTNALVQNCWIQDGDDDICIKNDTGLPSGNIVVSNCTFNGGHGVSVGSNIAGGLDNFIVFNCSFNGTIYGVRCKSDDSAFTPGGSGAGGLVQNLNYSNLTMTNVTYPIVIYSYYNEEGTPDEISPEDAAGEDVGPTNTCVIYRNITIANVTATPLSIVNHSSSIIWARLEEPASNITITNVNITAPSNTFCVYNAQGLQVIDSNLGDPNMNTNTFTLFNADITVTNSAANTNLITLGGLVVPGTNNTLAFFNGVATIANTNVLASNQTLTLGGSALTVSNGLSLGGGSVLNFSLGTNTAKIAAVSNLVLGGTLNVANGGGFNSGTYTLFTYGSTLTYNGLTIGTTPIPGFTYAISTNTHGVVSLIVSNGVTAPVAGFLANPQSGPVPLAVTFTDLSSNSPTAWYWTFGDGGVSTVEDPVHTYLNPGSYTATLIASNLGGASSPVTQTIGVYDPYQWWRLQYFGNTNSASGAPGADPLGKGISNTNQFLLGLNPTNPASVFRIIAIGQTGGTNSVTWKTSGGNPNAESLGSPTVITNIVQGSVGATGGSYSNDFSDISGPLIIVPPGDTVTNYSDASGTNLYYRIRLGP